MHHQNLLIVALSVAEIVIANPGSTARGERGAAGPFTGASSMAVPMPKTRENMDFVPVPSDFGDVDFSGVVDAADIVAVIGAWGVCPDTLFCAADMTGDSQVNMDDLLFVITHFGQAVD